MRGKMSSRVELVLSMIVPPAHSTMQEYLRALGDGEPAKSAQEVKEVTAMESNEKVMAELTFNDAACLLSSVMSCLHQLWHHSMH